MLVCRIVSFNDGYQKYLILHPGLDLVIYFYFKLENFLKVIGFTIHTVKSYVVYTFSSS